MSSQNIQSSKRITTRLKPIYGAPDLLPFVNIFFLLLFFLVLGSSFVPVSGIPVNLPEVTETRIYSIKKHILTVDKNNRIYFNDTLVKDLNDLRGKLYQVVSQERGSGRERPSIVLRTDKDNSFARIAGILALAEELKLNVFILARKGQTPQVDFNKKDKS